MFAYIFKANKKIHSSLVDFIFEEPKEGLLEFLLLYFTTLKKIDDYIKVLIFHHVQRCEQDNCLQYTLNT